MSQLPGDNDKEKIDKKPTKSSPLPSLMVGGLCRSLKNANEYRLSVMEKIRKQVGLPALQDRRGSNPDIME